MITQKWLKAYYIQNMKRFCQVMKALMDWAIITLESNHLWQFFWFYVYNSMIFFKTQVSR